MEEQVNLAGIAYSKLILIHATPRAPTINDDDQVELASAFYNAGGFDQVPSPSTLESMQSGGRKPLGVSTRPSLHYTLQMPVSDHAYGSFEGREFTIYSRLAQTIEANGAPETLLTADTAFFAPYKPMILPDAVVVQLDLKSRLAPDQFAIMSPGGLLVATELTAENRAHAEALLSESEALHPGLGSQEVLEFIRSGDLGPMPAAEVANALAINSLDAPTANKALGISLGSKVGFDGWASRESLRSFLDQMPLPDDDKSHVVIGRHDSTVGDQLNTQFRVSNSEKLTELANSDSPKIAEFASELLDSRLHNEMRAIEIQVELATESGRVLDEHGISNMSMARTLFSGQTSEFEALRGQSTYSSMKLGVVGRQEVIDAIGLADREMLQAIHDNVFERDIGHEADHALFELLRSAPNWPGARKKVDTVASADSSAALPEPGQATISLKENQLPFQGQKASPPQAPSAPPPPPGHAKPLPAAAPGTPPPFPSENSKSATEQSGVLPNKAQTLKAAMPPPMPGEDKPLPAAPPGTPPPLPSSARTTAAPQQEPGQQEHNEQPLDAQNLQSLSQEEIAYQARQLGRLCQKARQEGNPDDHLMLELQEKFGDNPAAIQAFSEGLNCPEAIRTIFGQVLEHGAAKYNHDPKQKMSYYVKLATDPASVPTIVWGLDLQRALRVSNQGVGDFVKLDFLGRTPVEVTADKLDGQGKVVGKELIQTNRNTWEATAWNPRLDQTPLRQGFDTTVKPGSNTPHHGDQVFGSAEGQRQTFSSNPGALLGASGVSSLGSMISQGGHAVQAKISEFMFERAIQQHAKAVQDVRSDLESLSSGALAPLVNGSLSEIEKENLVRDFFDQPENKQAFDRLLGKFDRVQQLSNDLVTQGVDKGMDSDELMKKSIEPIHKIMQENEQLLRGLNQGNGSLYEKVEQAVSGLLDMLRNLAVRALDWMTQSTAQGNSVGPRPG